MNNPTDTNQASELFELCKEVYKRTEWETPDWYDLDPDGKPEEYLCTTEDKIDENDYVPFYTSDYLLEKLPNGQRVVKVDEAYYVANNVQGLTDVNADGKSALVALLNFTLFLSKEGLL